MAANMSCEIVTIGTELTSGYVVDTNSPYIAQKLLEIGVECTRHSSVPDDVEEIARAIKEALNRVDIIVTTGGLGSTADDLTREALSRATGKKLVFDSKLAQLVQERFKRYQEELPEFVLKQAYIPEGSFPILSDKGTAPGISLKTDRKIIYVLPGVPGEMKKMFEGHVIPEIKEIAPAPPILTKTIKTCCLREAFLAVKIGHFPNEFKNVSLAFLPHPGEVHLRLMVKGSSPNSAKTRLSQAEQRLKELLGDYIFGFDEDTLEKTVGDLVRKYGLKLAVAESCTGGLIAHRLTNVPGSSDYLWGGITAYSNEMKKEQLNVPKEILLKEGAVSSAVAIALAQGIRELTGADLAIGATGIAGPTGGTPEKPVGLVFIALATKEQSSSERFKFWGSREEIKLETSQAALNLLRLYILEEYEEGGTAA